MEAGVGKESSPARKDWEAAWKNRVSGQQLRGNKQRDPVHLRNERVAWVIAMHKIHQSSSTENKPLGNTPFLLELAKRVWGCVHVYKPFYINCKYCCLRYVRSCLRGGNNPLAIQIPFDVLGTFPRKSTDPSVQSSGRPSAWHK